MINGYLLVEKSEKLQGEASVYGAKNAVLVIMASLILTRGKSVLKNVPNSADVSQMILLLKNLGAKVEFDSISHQLEVDTTEITSFEVGGDIMGKMRASILVMGSLLAREGRAKVALPGGCLIGARPVDFHIKGFRKMGVVVEEFTEHLEATFENDQATESRIVLDYPSVGATENFAMLAASIPCKTTIINAALEPEVFDFLDVLKKMGAEVWCEAPATLCVRGKKVLNPVVHEIVADRLEAGAFLLAAAVTKGDIYVSNMKTEYLDIFLSKLEEMGHKVFVDPSGVGVRVIGCNNPKAVSFKTGTYPGFPTDLQAPMMAAQSLATGTSLVEETVFENRLMHVSELNKMGAQITATSTSKATVRGVDLLYGSAVIASDIRASCALVLAGLAAEGKTEIYGIHHWLRGYDGLEKKLSKLGAKISLIEMTPQEEAEKIMRYKEVKKATSVSV
ncbi:TPA: UDP-N-acetylglucosamine 1-carboxyvinyltransferase [Candidatus Dependentiae bacterium]|nr:MAG: UDP-N-acetylglucosamine enolpyruvyl transferase [candidate division TM6 bacterium GW2011_GWE2_31_21]KKP54023.1 MAG: UDP-N-acetylglucosamine enolpyruvyl transferase [candidate division TM6 bacterium GW2011_GWF2_33_332]HBS48395.1 UDP-N-acetylglucosamine 1-carboxyvinyltransferase [Candidatus Dependentiae bacterium]HBZ72931.1 UDP-N-acetylglucosamine 1-carboxyvinyltransferase [Candidatus Dependentiae bacterium]